MTSIHPSSAWRARIGWLLGLPVLALLWAGATTVTAPVVGDALQAGSAAIVHETGRGKPEPWLRVEAQGRDLIALGEADDRGSRDAALNRLAAIPGLRRLDDRTGLIETASPFVWTLTRTSAAELEAGGHRPAEIGSAALASLLAPALAPETGFRDRAKAARGSPDGFAEAAIWLVGAMRGLAPGAVGTLSDTRLALRGEAADSAAYDAARATQPPAGFTLGTIDVVPPKTDDFRFIVERAPDGGLSLSGNVVSEEARSQALTLAAAVPAVTGSRAGIRDRLRAARGLDPAIDPSALTGFALRLVGLIREGSVRFEHGRLSVSGTALDEEAVGEAEAAMRDERPAGLAAGAIDLAVRPVSPYWVRLRREPGRVTLSGYLPDRAAREAMNGALRKRFLREAITDRSRISSGAPTQLVAALTGSLGPLSVLAKGDVEVSDRTIRLSGESLYPESAGRAAADLKRALPADWSGTASVVAPGAPPDYDSQTCARLFSERVSGRPLRFAPGSSELTPDFYPVLDALADIAKACRTEHVEVLGHVDPAGTPPPKPAVLPGAKAEKASSSKSKADKAQKPGKAAEKAKTQPQPAKEAEPAPDLAAARAAAIVDYLLKAGVPPEHALAAQGVAPLSDRQGIGLALRS